MQPSARQQELERLYNSRRGHVPQISISDDNYHVTEALGSYYGDEGPPSPSSPQADRRDMRPLSFLPGPADAIESQQQPQAQLQARRSRRNGSYFETKRESPPRTPLATTQANEKLPTVDVTSPSGTKTVAGQDLDHSASGNISPAQSTTTTPPLSRHPSVDTAVQHFPLNDIDYESSPAAVAQELSNLQAIRRMSMNVDNADPDLPSFAGGIIPAVAPPKSGDEDDTARLFWVPAHLHPELAPKEFKTFIEDRVDKIRRRSGDSETLSPDGLERSGSESSLRRKKSMLSHQIDTKGSYEDGAERLERKRSKGMSIEGSTRVDLAELESLVNDPAQLVRRMSLDTARRSLDSGMDVPSNEDMPMLPPVSQSLKRSTRTAYRKGSLKKGERVPLAKRAQQRQAESDVEDSSPRPSLQSDEAALGLTRVQTEPAPVPETRNIAREEYPPRQSSIARRQHDMDVPTQHEESPQRPVSQDDRTQSRPSSSQSEELPQNRPQMRQFQSRLASGHGRTTAQLPGYSNTNPLPQIFETLPDGTKVPVASLVQQIDQRRASFDAQERKRSGESARLFHRYGAHSRPIPGRDHQRSSTLDDLSSRPSLLPGSGDMGTDSLTFVPTFDERKTEKKEGPRRSTWKWVFGGDDHDKKAGRDDKSESGSVKSAKSSRLNKQPAENARLDVIQSSIEGSAAVRGRESLVLNRDDFKLDEERRKESKKSAESRRDGGRETGLLSAIFGGKKKSGDGDSKEKRRASRIDRTLSPDLIQRVLKPDIDYNWTRFSILEERAIYRMAHIKLANPRRALHSQVLLSNFMYSYLAKVQLMHPQVQIPAVHQKNHQNQSSQHQQQQSQEQQQQQQQPAEYSQYQRWQQQQDHNETDSSASHSSGYDTRDNAGFNGNSHMQHSEMDYEHRHGVDDYEHDDHEQYHAHEDSHSYYSQSALNGQSLQVSADTYQHSTNGGYIVADSHDYLGYPKSGQPFESSGNLWDDSEDYEDGSIVGTDGAGRIREQDPLW